MMTLILSCLTDEYAIQVSDRRLTYPSGVIAEDNENKVVDWGGQVAFGYTGLARILSKPTDYWLSEALLLNTSPQVTISLNDAIENVRTKATKDFKRFIVKDRRWKRLSIVGVGWIQSFDKNQSKPQLFDINQIKPAICSISNCLDDEGNTLAEPYEEFKAKLFMFNYIPNGFLVVPIGQPLDHHKTNSILRNIAKCIKQEAIGPEPITRLLIETIRDVAKENITVGRSVMVACIPKESLQRSTIPMPDGSIGFIVSSSKPQKFDRTFLYVPDGQDEGIEYGPNFVWGGSWLRDFSISRGKDKAPKNVGARTMRLEPGAKQGVIMFEDGTGAQFISPPQEAVIVEYEQAISDIDKTYINSEEVHFKNDLNDKIILELNRAIALNPETPRYYNERSIYYTKIGKYNEAIIDANKAISLAPQSEEGYIKRGFAFIGIRNFDEANDDFEKAIRINRDSAKAYCGKGIIYKERNQYDLAITDFDKAITLDPILFAAYGSRGNVYLLKQHYDSAILDFNKALTINQESGQFNIIYNSRGLAYLRKGAYIKAINDFNKALILNPDDFKAYHNRGIACQKIGKFDLAIRDQNKAIELNPFFSEAFDFRGVAYALTGKKDQAISDFNEAIKLKPDYSQAYNNRGLVYFNDDDLEKAFADFNKSLSLKVNVEAYYNRGLLFRKKGEFGNAIKDFKEALKCENDPALHKKIINQISAINGK